MIYPSSRYAAATLDWLSLDEYGPVYPVVIYNFDDLYTKSFSLHYYVEGERLDQLSFQYYQRPDMWWAIVEYNPEIEDFFNITPGTPLRIPNV